MPLHTKGIDHVNLQVSDLKESITFWETLLGFQLLEDMPQDNGVIIGTKEAKLALYENPDLGKVERKGFSHLCFHISNFDSAIEICEQLNIKILYDGIVAWKQSNSLYIEDPNGYEIELTDTWGGALDDREP